MWFAEMLTAAAVDFGEAASASIEEYPTNCMVIAAGTIHVERDLNTQAYTRFLCSAFSGVAGTWGCVHTQRRAGNPVSVEVLDDCKRPFRLAN